MDNITQCTKCGSTEFIVKEILYHNAEFGEHDDQTLYVFKDLDNGIDEISCKKCGTKHDQDNFYQIEF